MKFKFFTYLSALLISITILQSCKVQTPAVIAAEKAWNTEKYFVAADLYKQAIPTVRKKEDKAELTFKVAECYRLINNHKQSEVWYEKAIKAGYEKPDGYLRWAEAQRSQDKFEKAMETYQELLIIKPNDSLALIGLNMCKTAIKWKEKPNAFDVFNELGLNTKDFDYAPAYYGKGIIFTSNREPVKGKNLYERTGKGYENIYASSQTAKNKWTKAEPLNKDINTPYNEGVAVFDKENRILYFTQCNGAKGKQTGCNILQTTNEGANWTEPQIIPIPNPDSALIAHPSITADGKRLYFVSDMKGGQGGKDIWYSDKSGDAWSTPVNLGPKINTAGDEQFPFIHNTGTLYFSSNGHPGIGGLDMFYVDWEDSTWSEVLSLKSPINSSGDDFALVLDETKETGYFSSNRFGGKGEDDIYSAIAIPLVFTVYGKAINNQTQKVLPQTKVTLTGSDGQLLTAVTDNTGAYKFTLKKNVNYNLNASKSRFFGDIGEASTYGLKESKDAEVNFKLNPIPLKDIKLDGILYDLNSADLRPESLTILDSLLKTLKSNPNFVIEIASHTDSRADSVYNNELSQRRAQSVVDFLVTNGVEKERLVAKGYGESRLLNECKDGIECTEEQHQQNRRTAFQVLSEDYVPKEQKLPDAGKPKPNQPQKSTFPAPKQGAQQPGQRVIGTSTPGQPKPGTVQPGQRVISTTPAGQQPAGTQPGNLKPGQRVITTTPGGTTQPGNVKPGQRVISTTPGQQPAGTTPKPGTTTPAKPDTTKTPKKP
jgi:peptidoglycan-associated lipoprotein